MEQRGAAAEPSGRGWRSQASLTSPQRWTWSVESNPRLWGHSSRILPLDSSALLLKELVCRTERELKRHTRAGTRCTTFAPASRHIFICLAPETLVRPCRPVDSVRIQCTGDENATLLEFTTTSVSKIEFLRPHLGAGFSISQVLLLLA